MLRHSTDLGQHRIIIVVRLRQQIYSAFASVAQRPCCAFGERLPTSCRRRIVQIKRRRAGLSVSPSGTSCHLPHRGRHARQAKFEHALCATRKTLLRTKRCLRKKSARAFARADCTVYKIIIKGEPPKNKNRLAALKEHYKAVPAGKDCGD